MSTYFDPIEREYRETAHYSDNAGSIDLSHDIEGLDSPDSQTSILNGTNKSERFDPCCSDAADKYRDEYVDLRAIESTFWAYPDGKYLAKHAVNCHIPPSCIELWQKKCWKCLIRRKTTT